MFSTTIYLFYHLINKGARFPLPLIYMNYFLARISFCKAWICLLIEAIKETIAFRTSAFVTAPESAIEYETVFAESVDTYAGRSTIMLNDPDVFPTVNLITLVPAVSNTSPDDGAVTGVN
jgi:hypothetical protein